MNDNVNSILNLIGEYKEKNGEVIPKYCPFCEGGQHHDKETFAINKETGAYNCKRGSCAASGSIKQLCDFLGTDYKHTGNYFREYRKPKKIYSKPNIETNGLTQPIIDYFALRGISEQTLIKNKVSEYKGNIAFNYYEDGEVVFIKYKIPRKQRIINGKKEMKSWRETNTKPILYGIDDCIMGKPLIIVEGEPDKLVLDECGIPNAVSVPSGTQELEWIDLCWEFMQRFKEIIIWTDNDAAGIGLQQELIARLDDWKLKVVKSDEKDANIILHKYGKEKVIQCINKAETITKEYITNLANVKRKDYRLQTPISTGFEGLDRLLGGMYGGQLVVWTGYNGGGKSTILSNIILNGVEEGHKTFVYSGELPKEDFKEWFDLQASGEKHIDFYECPIKQTKLPKPNEKYFKLLDAFYDEKMYLYDSDDYAKDNELLKAMEYMAKREGAKVFVVDNLATMHITEKGDLNEKQMSLIILLKGFARKFNVVVHLVAHPKKPQVGQHRVDKYDISGTANISNLADRVFGFHRLTNKERGDEKQDYKDWNNVLMVFKDRKFGIFDEEVKFKFNHFSKRYYETDKQLKKEYSWVKNITPEIRKEYIVNDDDDDDYYFEKVRK
jgi:twinkle protein